jgi:hypothetical protein
MSWGSAVNANRRSRPHKKKTIITPLMAYEMMGVCIQLLRKNKRHKAKRYYPAEYFIRHLRALGYPDIHPVTLNRMSNRVFGDNWRTVKQDVMRGDYRRRCKPEEME